MPESSVTSESFDAIVIGTGQGGKPMARELGAAGKRTAIVERGRVGGTCLITGCTPTKTMVASARVAYLARRAAFYGVRTGPVEVEIRDVIARKREIVDTFSEGSRKRLEGTESVELIFGEASFTGPRTVRVALRGGGERRLEAPWIFINTGARPAVPPIEGIDAVPVLDNASIMELDVLPERLLVIGGGYVGLEFGQMFRRFGSEVAIVHRGRHLLSREDPDVADAVAGILREDGIDLHLESLPVRVSGGPGKIELDVVSGGREGTLSGTHLLVAAGRSPNTAALAPAAAGVRVDGRGFIETNERLETSAEGIWAMGDVKGGPAFTHISYDDFRILRTNLLESGAASTKGRLVPYTVFIDPQLGRVGLTETGARELGIPHRVAKLPMEHVARAIEMGETRGFMKAIVETPSGRILGAAVLGVEGGEVMAVLQTAMMGGLPYTALKEGVFAHPTLAESLNNLFMAMDA